MRLIEQKRKDSVYLYFLAGGKRIYLGKPDKLKEDKVKDALKLLDAQISEYNTYRNTLEKYLYGKGKVKFKKSKYKMIFFDLDGVIFEKPWQESRNEKVAISTWDILFKKLGEYETHEKLKKNFEDGLYGEDADSYMKWTEDACNFLKILKLSEKTFQQVIEERELSRGAKELFQLLKKMKIKTSLISGSFFQLAEKAKKELEGINYIYAHCKLNFDGNGRLESWKIEKTDYQDKKIVMEKIASKEGISLDDCVFVGDDVNDLEAFNAAGLAIAFNSQKSIVKSAAHVIIVGGDLTEILPPIFDF